MSLDHSSRGSITIYFALTFIVMVSLITTCIYSAKVEAGRARTANAADQAVFSLFANYDQSLFDQYQIFMIDGSCGTDHLSASTICNYLSQTADYILHPKKDHVLSRGSAVLQLEQTDCALTGYTLATDLNGTPFRAQAIQAEKDTLGLPQGHSGTSNSSASGPNGSSNGNPGSLVSDDAFDSGQSFTDYPAPESNTLDASSDTLSDAASDSSVEVPPDFVNPLPVLEALRNASQLPLVIDEQQHPISEKSLHEFSSSLISRRNLEKGFGMINAEGTSLGVSDCMLYQTYLMNHFVCFTDPFMEPSRTNSVKGSALSYELEYLIAEKDSDRKNLEKIVKKLLLQREAINFAFLETDSVKHQELSQEALLIATFLCIPEAEPLIQSLLALAWAYAESLVDVHALFSGKHAATVKTQSSWQVEIQDLPELLSHIASLEKDAAGGLSYRDYLELFLAGKFLSDRSASRLTLHAMDLVELNLRSSKEPLFRLDRCIDSLSFTLSVTAEHKVPLVADTSFSYRQK